MQNEIYNLSIHRSCNSRRLSSSPWATDRERWRLKEPPIERYVAVFLVGGEPPIESASFSFLAESHRKRPRHFVEESLRCQGFAVSPPREEKGKTKREKERRNETDRHVPAKQRAFNTQIRRRALLYCLFSFYFNCQFS